MLYAQMTILGLFVLAMLLRGLRLLLQKRRYAGLAALALALAEGLHLAPPLIGSLTELSPALYGYGRMLGLFALAFYYIIMYLCYERRQAQNALDRSLWLTVVGGALGLGLLCCLRQNEWSENGRPLFWTTLRALPLACQAAAVIAGWFSLAAAERVRAVEQARPRKTLPASEPGSRRLFAGLLQLRVLWIWLAAQFALFAPELLLSPSAIHDILLLPRLIVHSAVVGALRAQREEKK